MKNIFENAKFGDCFLTRDGRKAIYWASPEITGTGKHALIVDWTANGNYITCDDSGSCLGKFNIEHQSDIVSECENTDQEKEQLRDELDALHMRYLSQVSLWKSNYKELKEKQKESITKAELICVLDVLDLEYDDEYVGRVLREINRRLKTWKTYKKKRHDNKNI